MRQIRISRAFTLIELIFVIVLISLITTMAIPKISSTFGLNMKSSVIHVAGFMEASYAQAVITHKKVRLTFNLDTGDYWAENIVEAQLIPMISETTNLDEILNTFRKAAEEDNSNDEEAKKEKEAAGFQKIETASLKPGKIGAPLKFKSIIFPGKNETVNSGTVSFFISGSGINDEVVIYMGRGDDTNYSIIFPAITGKPKVEKGEAEIKKS